MSPSRRPQRGRRPGQGNRRRRGPQGTPLAGSRFTVEVGEVAHGGHCVARHEGRVIFVRHALPGEQVVVEVTSGTETSSFLRGDAVEVLRPAPQRRESPCRFSGPGGCGGCDFQHTDAAFGRELKSRVVREQLRRMAGLDLPVEVEAVPGDLDGLRWRTRVDLAVDGAGRTGLRKHRSHQVLDVDDCLIADERIISDPAWAQRFEGAESVHLVAPTDGPVVAVPKPGPVAPLVTETVPVDEHALMLQVRADGFWQVHPGAAQVLVQAAMAALDPQPGERALDLYGGVGLFATELARRVTETGSVLGVEGDQVAAEQASRNLADQPWASSRHQDVRDWAADHDPQTEPADVVVLDPPRSGAGKPVMEAVLAGSPRAVAYVACDPAALARDLATAQERGYAVQWVRAFDLFPMTHHVECLALLVPQG
ncbi:class I SAM-dependent RNA methyltransferase [Dermacoccaceae bacterium W4C1]